MATSFITGDHIISADEAQSSIKNYTPSVQESVVETPDEVDNSPITDKQRRRLDQATEQSFQNPFSESGEVRERADVFRVPGEWISPVIRDRQKKAMTLPAIAQIENLDQRIAKVMRFDGAPQAVRDLAQKARLAVGAARTAHESARHPDNSRFAISTTAKETVVQEVAKATAAVGAFEDMADASIDEWFEGLTENLDKQRADALKALRAAEKAYASLRASINTAQALAIAGGKWDKSWHSSTVTERELNDPISQIRTAIGYLEGDTANDYTDGSFLVAEYDGVPPHTLAKLKRGADVSQPGSFARQVYVRAVNPMPGDKDAQDAIREKWLTWLLNSNPLSEVLIDRNIGGAVGEYDRDVVID